jgi:RND family efflux transporter MFP subunit
MNFKRKRIWIAAIVLLAAGATWLGFTGRRVRASQSETAASLEPAPVVFVERRPLSNSLTLSGEFRPFQEVDVHAKIAGYIRKIYVDVGDHITAGQTLAVLEVPELSAQVQGADAAVRRAKDAIRRAQSDLNRAESLHAATHLDYMRLKQASAARPGLIAEQELDDAMAKDKEGEAQVSADEAAFSESQNQMDVAIAEQKQVGAMNDYTKIVAPFNGVVTKRYVDTGALVQAGTNSNTQALPVVSVAETDLFRLTLPVPESAVPSIRLGTSVKVHVAALKSDFVGKVARFADDLNQETRTMHTEVDVPNKNSTIVSGMYAEVTLELEKKEQALVLPVQAVDRNGAQPSVLVVDPQGRVQERQVRLGLEGANHVEIVSGLLPNERVIVGPRGQFRVGDAVAPKNISEDDEAGF